VFKIRLRDKMLLSFLSGILGTLVMYTIGLPMFFLGLTRSIYLLYSIELFVTPQIARTTLGFIAGFITGLIVGGTLALGFKLIMEWTGSDGIWYKALGYGAASWFVSVGLLRNFLNVAMYLRGDLQTNLFLLNQSLIYSVATAYFMIKLAGGREHLE
jgi:hypothetical protein